MRILIVNNMAPFIWGGAEELAVHLRKNLLESGYDADVLRIPFSWEPAERIPSQMMIARSLELRNVDLVIALKFPAYLIKHKRKTLWLLHQFRQAYDLYEQGRPNMWNTNAADKIRHAIVNADNECFEESRAIYTSSVVTQTRLQQFNGVASTVLPAPLNDPESFTGGESRGYIFAGGRINDLKRQHMLLEALALTANNVKLVVAGPPDRDGDAQKLLSLAEMHDLNGRLVLDLGFIPRAKYARYVNESAAVAYIPYDEDTLGYVTMEAAAAGKPVITTDDSGGVLGLVEHKKTGWVCAPHAAALSECFREAISKPRLAERLGQAARRCWSKMDINWPATISKLIR